MPLFVWPCPLVKLLSSFLACKPPRRHHLLFHLFNQYSMRTSYVCWALCSMQDVRTSKCRQCARESTKIISVNYQDNPVKLQGSTLPHRKTPGGQMCFRIQGFPDCRTAMCKLQMMLQSLCGEPLIIKDIDNSVAWCINSLQRRGNK